jgi:hypothetical protein
MTDESGTGALLFQSGDLGTPSAGVLTNCTGLPVASGISGLGTGVATALAVNTGSAGAVVLFNGALGTPSSGTLTNATGLPVATGISGLGTGIATFLATPSSANLIAAITDETGTGALVFATSPTLVTPALGTPSSGVLTSCTGLPLSTGVTGTLPIANGGTGLTSLGSPTQALRVNAGGTGLEYFTIAGTGDVVGPASVTDSRLAVFDGTTGKLLKQAAFAESDVGRLSSTQTFSGDKTFSGALTVPATVNYTGNGSIVKSGAGALTLSASGAFTLTVPATGTADLIGTAQTISAIKTHSAAIAFSGGTAANLSIWAASNVLRQRGGTSGWAVDNTSGTAIISATDAGALTVGPSTFGGGHTLHGFLNIDNNNAAGTAGISLASNNGSITGYVLAAAATNDGVTGSAAADLVIRNSQRIAFSANGGTSIQSAIATDGAHTWGASGGTALHNVNTAALTTSTAAGISYLRININGATRRIPTYNDA